MSDKPKVYRYEDLRPVREFLNKMEGFSARDTEECFRCGQTVKRLEKVGRCVYARPCGCRLWQGSVPKAWMQ